jgi:hypothetical protein
VGQIQNEGYHINPFIRVGRMRERGNMHKPIRPVRYTERLIKKRKLLCTIKYQFLGEVNLHNKDHCVYSRGGRVLFVYSELTVNYNTKLLYSIFTWPGRRQKEVLYASEKAGIPIGQELLHPGLGQFPL